MTTNIFTDWQQRQLKFIAETTGMWDHLYRRNYEIPACWKHWHQPKLRLSYFCWILLTQLISLDLNSTDNTDTILRLAYYTDTVLRLTYYTDTNSDLLTTQTPTQTSGQQWHQLRRTDCVTTLPPPMTFWQLTNSACDLLPQPVTSDNEHILYSPTSDIMKTDLQWPTNTHRTVNLSLK